MKESLVGRLFKEAGWAGVHGPLMEKAANEILRLTAELDAAREVIREMTGAEPVFEDARVGYVEVQVDKETWEEARALATTPPDTEGGA